MNALRLNKWQRLVVAAASIACLARAALIFQQAPAGGQPGAAFLTGVALAVVALARPRADERPWRLIEYLPVREGRQKAIGLAAALGLVLAIAVVLRISTDAAAEGTMIADLAAKDAADAAYAMEAKTDTMAVPTADYDAAPGDTASPVTSDDYVDPFADIASPVEARLGQQPDEDVSRD